MGSCSSVGRIVGLATVICFALVGMRALMCAPIIQADSVRVVRVVEPASNSAESAELLDVATPLLPSPVPTAANAAERAATLLRCWADGTWERDDTRAAHETFAYLRPLRDEERDPWYWKPRACQRDMEYFERHAFCDALAGRHLVFLGDSMNAHLALITLYLAASGTGPNPYTQPRSNTSMGKYTFLAYPICEDTQFPSHLSLLKNWQLTDDDIAGWEPGMQTFFEAVRNVSHAALVVVVNRGAHYTPDQHFVTEAERILHTVVHQPRALTVIWRDTPPGHANCTSYSGPLQTRQREHALPHHWGDFRRQNELISNLLAKKFPGVWYMDAYSPTSLRPDRHEGAHDCLHYRFPSALFHWGRLLYNILKLEASVELRGAP
jgi:hypothetical protein